MKYPKTCFAALALALSLHSISCYSTDRAQGTPSGPPAQDTGVPAIAAVVFAPATGQAGSSVSMTVTFDFSDTLGDLGGGTFNYTYEGVSAALPLDSSFSGLASGSGSVSGPLQLSATVGALTLPCWLVDSTGHASNTFNASFTQTAVPVPPATVARFAYVANQQDSTLSIYGVDAVTGALSPQGHVAAGSGTRSVAVTPSGAFAYAASATENSVYAFAIDPSNGALTPVGSPVSTGSGSYPMWITVDPRGKFAYTANFFAQNISVFAIDQTTGALVAGPAVTAGQRPSCVTADPAGRFLYASSYQDNTLTAYSINQTTGALTQVGAPVATGASPLAIAMEPSGRFAYVVDQSADKVSIFSIDPATGAAAAATPATIATGFAPESIAIEPTGHFAYTVNGSKEVWVYTIDQATGALTAGTPVPAGKNPCGITTDPAGKCVYATNLDDNTVSIYTIDSGTGALTAAGTVATGSAPMQIAIASGTPTGLVTLNTATATMDPGPYVSRVFSAVVTGFDDPSLTWTTTPADTGVITVLNAATISYGSPEAGGEVTLTATSVANPAVSASVVITVTPGFTPTEDIFNNWTVGGVSDNPPSPTSFNISTARHLVYFDTYHWNYPGAQPGLLSLQHSDGTVYGPWQAVGIIAYGGYFPRYWVCYPDIDLKAGTYTVVDSDPSTWSYDASVSGSGFAHLMAIALGN